jgi:outer membrane protein assembly factor BamE (lipoprotein component of BamABCDE complex)
VKWSVLPLLCLLLAGCQTSSVESRRAERLASYQSLSPEQKELVDKGQIKVGMNADAVYIAWGPPSEKLESESEQGHETTWIYHGQWMEESRFWTFREIAQDGTTFLERHLETEYFPRHYVRAEIVFKEGKVIRWRTFARPP